uniref:Integrase catalytic domain-containing protein n=1 Tax=Amphimedon queenslandica TaxID=400682 RepID=A0A1X7VA17_AMPQE
MDYFTKLGEAYPIPNMEATTVAHTMTNEMFFCFSPPERVNSDLGKQFDLKLIKEICRILQIKKSWISPYHWQGDGLVERYNRTLLDMLATSAKDQQARKLQNLLFNAYQLARDSLGEAQKLLYNRSIHGEPCKEGDLVWLHSPVVPEESHRKLHHP